MTTRKRLSEFLSDNETRAYYALDRAMLQAHRDRDHEKAETTARTLLEYAELPLLIRARACMVLGCSNAEDFLDMADEAVRVAELAVAGITDPNDFEKQLVLDCKTVRKEAKEAYDSNVLGGEGEASRNVEVVGEAGVATSSNTRPRGLRRKIEQTTPEEDIAEQAPKKKVRRAEEVRKKKVRRVHSGDAEKEAPMEELNEETGVWESRGPLREGEEVEIVEGDAADTK